MVNIFKIFAWLIRLFSKKVEQTVTSLFHNAGYELKFPHGYTNNLIRCDVYKDNKLKGRMFILTKTNRILFVVKHIGSQKLRYIPTTFKQALKIFQTE